MENTNETPERNKDINGYKVEGDGNAPNPLHPEPGNRSFEENPHAVVHKDSDDIPGKEFNTGDKAFFDSSNEDFVKTVSALHHTIPDIDPNITLEDKKPDGDR
jgi:hypothetical protein